MRRWFAVTSVVLLGAACQSTPPVGAGRAANVGTVEAVHARGIGEGDAAAAELLRAALLVRNQVRSIHLGNLANACTPAFKRRVPVLGTRLISGAAPAAPVLLGSMPIFAGGVIEDTGRGLDLAIEGHGLLAVWLPSGETGYTRDGRLHVNKDGKLVNTQDWVVRPGITVPSDLLELSIDVEGHVSGRTAGTPDSMTQLGQLTISRFIAPEQLREVSGVWMPTGKSGAPITQAPGLDGLGTLRQGCLERSNVDVGQELAELKAAEQEHRRLLGLAQQLGVDVR